MKNPFVIGITGGIGSGKSTFSEELRASGELVYDTDLEAKHLQNTNSNIIENIKTLFGDEIYGADGLNRQLLAQLVFSNQQLLTQLNTIIHPAVRTDIAKWIDKHSNHRFLFVECALLLEGNLKNMVDAVLLITAPMKVRLRRVMLRDGSTREQVMSRMRHQLSEEEKKKYAKWVIDTNNNFSVSELTKRFLLELYEGNKK